MERRIWICVWRWVSYINSLFWLLFKKNKLKSSLFVTIRDRRVGRVRPWCRLVMSTRPAAEFSVFRTIEKAMRERMCGKTVPASSMQHFSLNSLSCLVDCVNRVNAALAAREQTTKNADREAKVIDVSIRSRSAKFFGSRTPKKRPFRRWGPNGPPYGHGKPLAYWHRTPHPSYTNKYTIPGQMRHKNLWGYITKVAQAQRYIHTIT